MKRIPNKNKRMNQIEAMTGEGIEETLRRLYVDEEKSAHQICDELQLSYATTLKWLRLSGVYSRRLDIEE